MPALAPSSTATRRVVIAEAHPGMRRALGAVLSVGTPTMVLAEVANLSAAGAAIRAYGADTLVVDADLLADHRFELGPLPAGVSIVALGMEHHPGAGPRALRHGADAYVVKDRAHLDLADAVIAAR